MARRRRLGLLASVLSAAVVVGALGGVSASALDMEPFSVPTVVILDASGSMTRDAPGGGSRMDLAKTATNTVIDAMPSWVDLGLLVFGTGTGSDDSEKAAGCVDVKTIAVPGALSADAMKAEVNAIAPSGFTPLGASLTKAAEYLPTEGPATIVLVSDGVDTCAPPPACEIASDLRVQNPELIIHVVGFAIDDDEAAQGQLQCIGAVGGGTYVTATDADQLSARLGAAVTTSSVYRSLNALGAMGVKLGQTLDAARTALGDSARIIDRQTIDGVEVIWIECEWGTVILRDGKISDISTNDDSQTPDGVRVGDPLTTAEAIYGGAVDSGSDDWGSFSTFAISPNAPQGYRIYTDAKNITRIVLCLCVPVSTSADQVSTWEVSHEGVGPLKIGGTTQSVLDLFPAAVGVPSYDGSTTTYTLFEDPSNAWSKLSVVTDTDDVIVSIQVGNVYAPDASATSQNAAMPELAGLVLPHLNGIRLGDSGRTADNVFPGMTALSLKLAGADRLLSTDEQGRVLSIWTARSSQWPKEMAQGPIVGFVLEDGTRWKSFYLDH